MSRPLIAEIRPEALSANLEVVRLTAPGAKVWAVAKALGYGHGLDAVLQGLAGADGLALVEFEAADLLRQRGYRGPLLMLEGAFAMADVKLAREQGLSLVLHGQEQMRWLDDDPDSGSDAGNMSPAPVPVWIKLNTGMHRLGFEPSELEALVPRLSALQARRRIVVAGWMTHFANADLPGGADVAWQGFQALRAVWRNTHDWPISVSNSAAILRRVAPGSDWVRPGIMLYGASPFADQTASSLGLRPAMRLSSRLIAVRHLNAGDRVGYGSTFIAERPMRMGVVACGYADGYPRHAPTGTPIAVAGVRTRVVGRVSMDMITVDLDPVAHADCGSEVELWGDQIGVDEVAEAAGTIAYELLCALSPRVTRRLV
jgi:alanine racemase